MVTACTLKPCSLQWANQGLSKGHLFSVSSYFAIPSPHGIILASFPGSSPGFVAYCTVCNKMLGSTVCDQMLGRSLGTRLRRMGIVPGLSMQGVPNLLGPLCQISQNARVIPAVPGLSRDYPYDIPVTPAVPGITQSPVGKPIHLPCPTLFAEPISKGIARSGKAESLTTLTFTAVHIYARAERLWIFQHHDYCIHIITIIDYITIMLKVSV